MWRLLHFLGIFLRVFVWFVTDRATDIQCKNHRVGLAKQLVKFRQSNMGPAHPGNPSQTASRGVKHSYSPEQKIPKNLTTPRTSVKSVANRIARCKALSFTKAKNPKNLITSRTSGKSVANRLSRRKAFVFTRAKNSKKSHHTLLIRDFGRGW